MSPLIFNACIFGLFGLLVGSFLNVVVFRLPIMLERQWRIEAAQIQGQAALDEPAFNLATPRSTCKHCSHQIRWFENIPVLSFLFLKGQCSSCSARISFRYPLVELATAAIFGWFGFQFGLTLQAVAWCAFGAMLLSMALIDWDTTLLPDVLTQPLVWMGLLASYFSYTGITWESSLWGAVIGYMSLWTIYWLFKLVTGKEGMGHGDFKLLAALGAWFGAGMILPIVIASSVIGALVGIYLKLTGGLREGKVMPFGPFLAAAGFSVFFGLPGFMSKIFGL